MALGLRPTINMLNVTICRACDNYKYAHKYALSLLMFKVRGKKNYW